MIKKCYILDEKVINIGEWDYQKTINEQGTEVVNNPLPEGATEENRDFEYNEERGWYEVGKPNEPTSDEQIKELEEMVLFLMLNGGM